MKEIKLKGITLTMYEHSDELPVEQYNLANEYALLDAETGNTMEDVKRHENRLGNFIAKKDIDGVTAEWQARFQTMFNIREHNNHIAMQFMAYVKAIDEKPLEDYSHEGLKRLIPKLSKAGLTMGIIRNEVIDVKKKSKRN